MNIVVLCGGTSTERAISLISSEGICRALQKKGHHCILMDVFTGHEGYDEQIFQTDFSVEEELEYIHQFDDKIEDMKKSRKEFFGPAVLDICRKSDFVFLGLHGANGEDGKVQAVLELFGIPYSGADYLSSAMAMNKSVTRQIFAGSGVPMAKGYTLKKGETVAFPKEKGVSYPCIVKPSCGGSSVGVFFVEDETEYLAAVEGAFRYEDEIVVEQRIIGKEFSVGVVEYQAYPVIQIIPKQGNYDYENKYKAGATDEICPALISEELTNKVQNAAVEAAKSLMLDTYCRIDVLTDEQDNCYCLEANTLPGMTPTSLLPKEAAVLGMDYESLCEHLIEVSMKKYGQKKGGDRT